MGEVTGIDWTDHTFNPWWGCTKVNEGCTRCYAERDSKRYGFDIWGEGKPRRTFGDKHWNEPIKWNAAAQKAGRRDRVFTASMADVFDKDAPVNEQYRLFELIRATPFLDWQVLTKRYAEAVPFVNKLPGAPWPNLWLIYSASTQETLDIAAPFLEQANTIVRGISWEPALGPINISAYPWLDWIIGGDESGSGGRIASEDWYRSVRDQAREIGAAYFIKQFMRDGKKLHTPQLDGQSWTEYPR